MKITVLTLFPEMFAALDESIVGRAQKEGKVQLNVADIRAYTEDKHLKCDDYPFGGGAGMVMMAQPIGSAVEANDPEHLARRIYLSRSCFCSAATTRASTSARSTSSSTRSSPSATMCLRAANCPPWCSWTAFRAM